MKSRNIMAILTAIAAAIVLCIVMAFILSIVIIVDTNGVEKQKSRELKEKTCLIDTYADVLHRVWIDNPSYVEDVLWETDEFENLQNSVDDKGFEDIFMFWSEKDSIEYLQNCRKRMVFEPDTIPNQPKHDKSSSSAASQESKS